MSFVTPNTKPLTIMKRVGYHGNDLERIEKLNALSRRICAEVPDPETAQRWLKETTAAVRSYAVWIYYLGNFMAAAGFCCVFGGTVRDWLWAGLSGLIIGFVTRCMDRLEVNPFFSTIAASFLMALPAYVAAGLGWLDCVAVVIIGALMLLVPGLLITNSMRDIIYGDTSSGVSRIVQVLLSAFAIALGTAAAWHVTTPIYGHAEAAAALTYPLWGQRFVRARQRADMDRVPAVQQGRVQYLQRQLLFRGRGRRVFRGHGALAQVPGHVLSGHLQHSAAAWRRYLLYDEHRPFGLRAGGAACVDGGSCSKCTQAPRICTRTRINRGANHGKIDCTIV